MLVIAFSYARKTSALRATPAQDWQAGGKGRGAVWGVNYFNLMSFVMLCPGTWRQGGWWGVTSLA